MEVKRLSFTCGLVLHSFFTKTIFVRSESILGGPHNSCFGIGTTGVGSFYSPATFF